MKSGDLQRLESSRPTGSSFLKCILTELNGWETSVFDKFMLRIKNRRANIPNGYLYVQKETGFDVSKVMPHTVNDFNAVCMAIRQHRLSNPQFKLNTSLPAIEAEVEAVNVARIAAMPGAKDVYLMDVGGAQPSFQAAPTQSLQVAVAAAKALSAGAKTILDFEESGDSPVANELATQRAEVCATCPKNETGDLTRFFTIPAATRIKAQLERAHAMKLTTALDDKLNICGACLCPLKLKVHFPLSFIVKHMSNEVRAQLDLRCWILGEEVPEKEAA